MKDWERKFDKEFDLYGYEEKAQIHRFIELWIVGEIIDDIPDWIDISVAGEKESLQDIKFELKTKW